MCIFILLEIGIKIDKVNINENIQYKIINENDIWDCPRYSEVIQLVKERRLKKCIKTDYEKD